MDWRREQYVWVPVGTVGTLQAVGLEAQALLVYLARLCDPHGVIRCRPGESRQGLARLCGAHLHERRMFSAIVEELHEAGSLRGDPDGVRVPEFGEWQRTRDTRVRLFHRETADVESLPVFTRAIGAHLTRLCTADGLVRCAGPLAWSETASRAQYRRGQLDRRMARRVACHLDALLSIGFLERTEGGLLLPHHVVAQRKAEPRAVAHDPPRPRLDAAPTLPRPCPDPAPTLPRRSEVSPGNHTIDVVPPFRPVLCLSSDPPSVPPRAVAQVQVPTPPARVQAPAPGLTDKPVEEQPVQGSLFGDDAATTPTAAKGRRKKIPAPVLDMPINEGAPGYDTYDFILRHPMLSLLVTKPGEFVLSALKTYTRIDVFYEVQRAAEYLLASSAAYSDGRAFLRRWLDRAQDDAKRKGAVDAVRLARGITQGAIVVTPAAAAPTPPAAPRFAAAAAAGVAVAVHPWGQSPRRDAR